MTNRTLPLSFSDFMRSERAPMLAAIEHAAARQVDPEIIATIIALDPQDGASSIEQDVPSGVSTPDAARDFAALVGVSIDAVRILNR